MQILPSRLFPALCLLAVAGLLTSCESEVAASRSTGSFATAPNERPGLGTKWGEERNSAVRATEFRRSDPSHPTATAAIYYDDEKGIRAMGGAYFSRGWAFLPGAANGLVSVGLKGDGWGMLPGANVNGRWFVAGQEGHRYSIIIRNRTDERLEVVASVDGLDVLDGRAASPRKRGYLLQPHATQVIDGFRKSTDTVAAFRFGAVSESVRSEKVSPDWECGSSRHRDLFRIRHEPAFRDGKEAAITGESLPRAIRDTSAISHRCLRERGGGSLAPAPTGA